MTSTIDSTTLGIQPRGERVDWASLLPRVASAALWLVLAAVIFVIIVAPILYVMETSLHEDLRFGVSATYTLKTLADVYFGATYLDALREALVLSALVTTFSVGVGLILALIVARIRIPAAALVNVLILMPMFLSPFNGLIAWISLASEKTGFLNLAIAGLFRQFGLAAPTPFNILSYSGAVWVMFLFFTPYVYLFTVTNLQRMDSSLEEAARASGAGAMRTLLRITIPICLPSILAAALLVFILASETYTIPGLIGGTTGFTVLPWQIYTDAMHPPVRAAHAAAAASMLLLATIVGVLLQRKITSNSERYATVLGKGRRSTPFNIGPWRGFAVGFVWLYIVLSTVLPLGVLLLSSFLPFTTQSVSWDMLTLRHYVRFFGAENTRAALSNTIMLAIGASMICMMVGAIISYSEVRTRQYLPRLLAIVCVLPVAVPGIVYGLGLQRVYLQTPFYGTVVVLLLAYVAKYLPYGIMVSRSAILQIHPELEQCARTCGAGKFRTLTRISMPLIAASLASVVFFVMLLSMKELSATLVLYTQRSETLAVLTWAFLEGGEYQYAAAVAMVQTTMIIALVLVVRIFFKIRLETIGGKGS